MNEEGGGEAGSFFGSESEPAQESQHVVEQGAGVGAADSVNYGAQSPRVPRSQISRAHPGQTLGYAERTSAVLSALSGDDETALSAAEAAGEHTSHPQLAAGASGLPPAPLAAAGAAGEGPPPGPAQQQQQQQQQQHQAQELAAVGAAAAAASRLLGAEDPLSPPESTSPMYRANSVVSHTAAPLRLPALKRPAETPISAPALPGTLLGASPTTSRVEFSHRLPFGPPPLSGRSLGPRPGQQQYPRPSSQQQQQHQQLQFPVPPGPSYVSLSHTHLSQHQAAAAAAHPQSSPAGPLPSTLGVAIGMPPAPVFAPPPLAVTSPASAAIVQPVNNLAAWVGLAASMGVPLEVLQAQGSVIQGGQQAGPQAQLQQAEALQSMAAALQAQASVILQQQQAQAAAAAAQHAAAAAAASEAPAAASVAPAHLLPPAAGHHAQQQGLQPPQPQHAVIEASGGGASMYSVPDLVGASVIQGHPLPPPFYPSGGAAAEAAAPAPTLISGVTHPPPDAADGGAAGDDMAAGAAQQQAGAVHAAGSSQQLGSGYNRGSASPTAAAARDPRLAPTPAQASSMVHGQYRPPRAGAQPGSGQRASVPAVPEPAGAAAAADAVVSAGRQGSARAADLEAALHGMPSTDAAAIGGNLGDEAANDGLEVQQAAPFVATGGGGMQPGTADTGDDRQRGDGAGAQQPQQLGELEGPGPQQGGTLPPAPHGAASVMATLVSSGEQSDVESEISAPHSHPAPAAARSPLPSMQPAAATTNAHMGQSLVAATASQPAPAAAAGQEQQQHSTSGQSPQREGGAGSRLATVETGADDDAAGGSVDMTAPAWRVPPQQPAVSEPLRAGGGAAAGEGGGAAGAAGPGTRQHHPAASAPMVLPGQAVEPDQPQPAISVSLSAHCEVPGPPGHFAEHNPAAPQAQSSAFVFKRQQQRTSAGEEHYTSNVPQPAPAPGDAMMEEGQGEGQPAPAEEGGEGGGSPRASRFNARPAASEGTARGTILAGQAHSILTTAAAGDGEHGEAGEEVEALSPLLVGRAPALANGLAAGKYAQHLAAGAAAATNSATIPAAASSPAGAAAAGADAAGTAAAAASPPGPLHGLPPAEPMDLSTMAQDLGGPAGGSEPEPTLLSGQQPSAALLRAQQACQQQAGVLSSGYGASHLAAGGIGAGAESVQANGYAEEGAEEGQHAEVAQPLANGEAMDGVEAEGEQGAAGGHAYASSIILGNGFIGGGSSGAAAAAAAAATAAAAAGGSELTSPSSVSGKRRQQGSKRKRGGGE